ncbi:MAG: hypothetical protein ABI651_18515 [Verrucomicrobiota bacterium]
MQAKKLPPRPRRKKRVLLVDDHPMMRQGLSQLINQQADLMVCAEAGDATDAIDADLPAQLKDWLKRCIAEKTPGSAGLVAMLESHRSWNDVKCRTRQLLQRAASRGGLDFFLHEVDLLGSDRN